MAEKDTIQELNDLGSEALPRPPAPVPFRVPEGYFEQFPRLLLDRIRFESGLAEPDGPGPLLSQLSRQFPAPVPDGYFTRLPLEVLTRIRTLEDHQAGSREETSALSPLLGRLSRELPYSVPAGYFDQLGQGLRLEAAVQPARVVSLKRRSWMRYAVAAAVIGLVALTGLLLLTGRSRQDAGNPTAWVEKSMKKVSTSDINTFIQLADEEATQPASLAAAGKDDDIRELMKDVSDKDIQRFLKETSSDENNADNDDLILN
ncbi:MAG TPA: hypothetical protein VG870_03630 [Chitinophagaceae bacterium]|nr:hypothetical protein [Chitinophagaceae bacterium]